MLICPRYRLNVISYLKSLVILCLVIKEQKKQGIDVIFGVVDGTGEMCDAFPSIQAQRYSSFYIFERFLDSCPVCGKWVMA